MANKLAKIQNMIYEIRGQKVMFDNDLADLYGVELRSLNQAVKRNTRRFPKDFMFQLTDKEWKNQRSQNVIFVYMENTDNKLSKHDKTIGHIILALNNLIKQPPKTRPIGFNAGD